MQLKIVETSRFKKSLKRVKRQDKFNKAIFIEVVNTLASQATLDKKYKDHQLAGRMHMYRECHLSPDMLLIYQFRDEQLALALINIGNHSQLFK